jgi:hypothetical protein
MEGVVIFCGHAVYFTAIRHILLSFGIILVILVSLSRFGILCHVKNLATLVAGIDPHLLHFSTVKQNLVKKKRFTQLFVARRCS